MLYSLEDVQKIHINIGYYIPETVVKNPVLRTELKWGYTALVNVLIKDTLVDDDNNPYVVIDNPMTIEMLKALANKKVDQEKINTYIDELEELGFVVVKDNKVYIDKI